eukprot:COSAG01_NODE_74_length_28433_cov_41.582269_5_plen_156_part_00
MERVHQVAMFNNEEIRIAESKDKLHRLQARFRGQVRLVGSRKTVKFQHHVRDGFMIKVHGRGDRRTAPCHLALLSEELLYSFGSRETYYLQLRARIQLADPETRFEDLPDEFRGSNKRGFCHRIGVISAEKSFVSLTRLLDDSPWLQFPSECQRG